MLSRLASLILLLVAAAPASADWAEFRQTASGCTATYNGQAITLPAGFRINVVSGPRSYTLSAGVGQTAVGIDRWYWVEDYSPAHTDTGLVGRFSSFVYPDGLVEINTPMLHQVGGQSLAPLVGEPVTVTVVGAETVVRIGGPTFVLSPPAVDDLLTAVMNVVLWLVRPR